MSEFDQLMSELELIEFADPKQFRQTANKVIYYLENTKSLTCEQVKELQIKVIRMIIKGLL